MIRVLIAESYPVYRDGLLAAIRARPGMKAIGTTESGDAALRAVRSEQPDVLVLDVDLTGIAGLTVIRAIAEEDLATRTLVVSANARRSMIYEAVSAGASGYLLKSEDASVICEGIVRIAGGENLWDGEVQQALADEIRGRGNSDGSRSLSPREIEILKMVADGRTTSEIAAALYLSTATVKTHLHRSFAKLEVGDRAAAVAESMRRGLFD